MTATLIDDPLKTVSLSVDGTIEMMVSVKTASYALGLRFEGFSEGGPGIQTA
jgi:hypothetical protein